MSDSTKGRFLPGGTLRPLTLFLLLWITAIVTAPTFANGWGGWMDTTNDTGWGFDSEDDEDEHDRTTSTTTYIPLEMGKDDGKTDCINMQCPALSTCRLTSKGEYACECLNYVIGTYPNCVDPCAHKLCKKDTCKPKDVDQYRCKCVEGYYYDNFLYKCVVDPCDDLCESGCWPLSPTTYECGKCIAGYEVNKASGACEPIPYCSEGRHDCGCNSRCTDLHPFFKCECRTGYFSPTGDGKNCKRACDKVDLCQTPCEDIDHERYECECKPGYVYSREEGRCIDIVECKDTTTCGAHSTCVNFTGGYSCECNEDEGWFQIGNLCVNVCTSLDVCLPDTCEGLSRTRYKCDCAPGYYYDDTAQMCRDKDECKFVNGVREYCHESAHCRNLTGSYECYCLANERGDPVDREGDGCVNPCTAPNNKCMTGCGAQTTIKYYCDECHKGYKHVEGICTDIDECEFTMLNFCHKHATCINVPGTYLCKCNDGWYGDGRASCVNPCVDNQFCDEAEDDCTPHGLRRYECTCIAGYEWDQELQVCRDVDECDPSRTAVCDEHAICFNTAGSYRCECDISSGWYGEGPPGTCRSACEDGSALCSSICRGVSPGGYLCACIHGYTYDEGLERCVDVDECRKFTHDCHRTASCVNSVGSHKCECPEHTYGDPKSDGEGCVNPCDTVNHCFGECKSVEDGKVDCECEDGYELINYVCTNINECHADHEAVCVEHAACTDLDGSYKCTCVPPTIGGGYLSKGGSCVDPCNNTFCEEGCEPKGINGYLCDICIKGYTYNTDLLRCVETDECKTAKCHEHAVCQRVETDGVGGFTCLCDDGYAGSGLPVKNGCVNPCLYATNCDGECVTKGEFTYECDCKEGFHLIDGECIDITECTDGVGEDGRAACHPSAKCIELSGSYKCACVNGRLGDGTFESTEGCVDPCENSRCQFNCEAKSTVTYTCGKCEEGYYMFEGKCIDIKECDDPTKYCNENAECLELDGGYECVCKGDLKGNGRIGGLCIDPCYENDLCKKEDCVAEGPRVYKCTNCLKGYIFDTTLRKCTDENECLESGRCHEHAKCINNVGGFSCECIAPWVGDGFAHDDGCSNACATATQCHEGTCTNEERGGYYCVCEDGYKLDLETKSCVDINECVEGHKGKSACHISGHCNNTPGEFTCTCVDNTYGNAYPNSVRGCVNFCDEDNLCKRGCQATGIDKYNCPECIEGYKLVDGRCVDINECEEEGNWTKCHEHSKCVNHTPGYSCECVDGYFGNGFHCDNMCERDLLGEKLCVENCTPLHDEDHYLCGRCKEGFTYSIDKRLCVDIIECDRPNACQDNADCINTYGGHKCKCRYGWWLNEDEECHSPCTLNDLCDDKCVALTMTTYDCVCKSGFVYDNTEKICKDINECLKYELSELCGLNAKCVNYEGSYACQCIDDDHFGDPYPKGVCVNVCDNNTDCVLGCKSEGVSKYFCSKCREGYTFNANLRRCEDINECMDESNPCQVNAECVNKDPGFNCVCVDGYWGIGHEGENSKCYNPCDETQLCQYDCISKGPSAYSCHCIDGYKMNKERTACVDIDECVDMLNPCAANARCDNEVGSHTCTCKEGYKGNAYEGAGCVNPCDYANFCESETCIATSEVYYSCKCVDGYRINSDKGLCEDEDECKYGTHNCHATAKCRNTNGSFECYCPFGYQGDAYQRDEEHVGCVNPCNSHNPLCIHGCVADPFLFGKYLCGTCLEGYEYDSDKKECVDTDECNPKAHKLPGCWGGAICVNKVGSHECFCPDNYYPIVEAGIKTCVNPCDRGHCKEGCIPDGPLSYDCTICDEGYTLDTDAKCCKEVNECENKSTCHEHASCVNTSGSYSCSCDEGYTGTGANVEGGCVNPCMYGDALQFCNGVCTPHGYVHYECECIGGYTFDRVNMECIDIDECKVQREGGKQVCHETAYCENTKGGYTCACNEPFWGDPVLGGIGCVNICFDKKNLCDKDCVSKSRTSYTCGTCMAGYEPYHESDLDFGCRDIDECAVAIENEEPICGQNAICENVAGSFDCFCETGLQGNPYKGGYCANPCDNNTECEEGCFPTGPDLYRCKYCFGGYTYSWKDLKCVDVNECLDQDRYCTTNSDCVNTIGKYRCTCKDGYIGDNAYKGGLCINSCENTDLCVEDTCIGETAHAYRCDCIEGYEFDTDQRRCIDKNECVIAKDKGIQLCGENAECRNTDGSFECHCKDGWHGDGDLDGECINPCKGDDHHCSLECRSESQTTYKCGECDEGWIYNITEFRCVDRPECKTPLEYCHPKAICHERIGWYSCECIDGYWGNGLVDGECRNPCLEEDSLCDIDCKSTGTHKYTCGTCKPGYSFNPEEEECQDINECKLCVQDGELITNAQKCVDLELRIGGVCHSMARCKNTIGSYECTCPPNPYGDEVINYGEPQFDGEGCKNICNPKYRNHCDDGCTPINFEDYHCDTCDDGWVPTDTGCKDRNECEDPDICAVGAKCINLPGSYKCVCLGDLKGDADEEGCISVCGDPSLNKCSKGCKNRGRSTYLCDVCEEGYYWDLETETCRERNECLDKDQYCVELAKCENTDGSYKCICESPFKGDGRVNGNGCINVCDDLITCEPDTCSPIDQERYNCDCATGFDYDTDNEICIDVPECTDGVDGHSACHETAKCIEQPGSFDCVCPKKTYGEPTFGSRGCSNVCENIEENRCELGCSPEGEHVYSCKNCMKGYIHDGKKCVDVDECTEEYTEEYGAVCNDDAICENTVGSYTCTCKNNLHGNGYTGGACVDPCPNPLCETGCETLSPTKYRCTVCVKGFHYHPSIKQCTEEPYVPPTETPPPSCPESDVEVSVHVHTGGHRHHHKKRDDGKCHAKHHHGPKSREEALKMLREAVNTRLSETFTKEELKEMKSTVNDFVLEHADEETVRMLRAVLRQHILVSAGPDAFSKLQEAVLKFLNDDWSTKEEALENLKKTVMEQIISKVGPDAAEEIEHLIKMYKGNHASSHKPRVDMRTLRAALKKFLFGDSNSKIIDYLKLGVEKHLDLIVNNSNFKRLDDTLLAYIDESSGPALDTIKNELKRYVESQLTEKMALRLRSYMRAHKLKTDAALTEIAMMAVQLKEQRLAVSQETHTKQEVIDAIQATLNGKPSIDRALTLGLEFYDFMKREVRPGSKSELKMLLDNPKAKPEELVAALQKIITNKITKEAFDELMSLTNQQSLEVYKEMLHKALTEIHELMKIDGYQPINRSVMHSIDLIIDAASKKQKRPTLEIMEAMAIVGDYGFKLIRELVGPNGIEVLKDSVNAYGRDKTNKKTIEAAYQQLITVITGRLGQVRGARFMTMVKKIEGATPDFDTKTKRGIVNEVHNMYLDEAAQDRWAELGAKERLGLTIQKVFNGEHYGWKEMREARSEVMRMTSVMLEADEAKEIRRLSGEILAAGEADEDEQAGLRAELGKAVEQYVLDTVNLSSEHTAWWTLMKTTKAELYESVVKVAIRHTLEVHGRMLNEAKPIDTTSDNKDKKPLYDAEEVNAAIEAVLNGEGDTAANQAVMEYAWNQLVTTVLQTKLTDETKAEVRTLKESLTNYKQDKNTANLTTALNAFEEYLYATLPDKYNEKLRAYIGEHRDEMNTKITTVVESAADDIDTHTVVRMIRASLKKFIRHDGDEVSAKIVERYLTKQLEKALRNPGTVLLAVQYYLSDESDSTLRSNLFREMLAHFKNKLGDKMKIALQKAFDKKPRKIQSVLDTILDKLVEAAKAQNVEAVEPPSSQLVQEAKKAAENALQDVVEGVVAASTLEGSEKTDAEDDNGRGVEAEKGTHNRGFNAGNGTPLGPNIRA